MARRGWINRQSKRTDRPEYGRSALRRPGHERENLLSSNTKLQSLPVMPICFLYCRLSSSHLADCLPVMPTVFLSCRLSRCRADSFAVMPTAFLPCRLSSCHADYFTAMPTDFPYCRTVFLPCRLYFCADCLPAMSTVFPIAFLSCRSSS